jgi:hypothetical protein
VIKLINKLIRINNPKNNLIIIILFYKHLSKIKNNKNLKKVILKL